MLNVTVEVERLLVALGRKRYVFPAIVGKYPQHVALLGGSVVVLERDGLRVVVGPAALVPEALVGSLQLVKVELGVFEVLLIFRHGYSFFRDRAPPAPIDRVYLHNHFLNVKAAPSR